MDQLLRLTLLYDFYGDLLTEKQRTIFELYHLFDLSLQEIGEQFAISRQAVNDLLKRTEKILTDYDSKLALVAHHLCNKEKMRTAVALLDDLIGGGVVPSQEALVAVRRYLSEINL